MLDQLNFAYGAPTACGQIKQSPEDFCVEEALGFELTGEGEHLFLYIEKKLLNTEDMVRIIATSLDLPPNTIAYAGLKDKFATTSQWFSLHLPGLDNPNLDCLNTDNHRVLKAMRHNKKLRIGALKENHFKIKIHQLTDEQNELQQRIALVKAHGVPNYFGPQRFGHNGNNLQRAKEVLLENKKIKNRHLRGIYYSAARSFLFNEIVSLRVKEACWNRPLSGDVMMLAGSHSIFPIDLIDEQIEKRISEHDIFPAAPLWGRGKEIGSEQALLTQQQALSPWLDWCIALEEKGLERAYRAMVLVPDTLQFKDDLFTFSLPPGTYATTVLRELLMPNDV